MNRKACMRVCAASRVPYMDEKLIYFIYTLALHQVLLILWRTIEDHDTLFVLAEAAHFVGIGLLGWKIWSKKSVAGDILQSRARGWGLGGMCLCSGRKTALRLLLLLLLLCA